MSIQQLNITYGRRYGFIKMPFQVDVVDQLGLGVGTYNFDLSANIIDEVGVGTNVFALPTEVATSWS